MNDDGDKTVGIFSEAKDLSATERRACLVRACGNDENLRARVEALLRAHDRAGDFLKDTPAYSTNAKPVAPVIGEKPGDRVGRYKLLQQIGEGGCGVVFMAEQEEPVRRRVALKVIKPGMDTRSVIARFESERQALALMEHPNIAQVLDAGATDAGRPYFVMELVRGIKITDYCDQNSLTTQARLELFTEVCHAIQHAHQKGIIHRDIKPSNILVTTTAEGKPLPKVIDFGIAKATTGQRLTDKTLFTAFEMLIGTPAYMSPEQAALTSMDVDTRTDIYSLGVLLYELLTSTTPFDAHELLKSGLDEIRRVILNQDPMRPSTRLSTMLVTNLTTVAQRRQVEAQKLIRVVRGDLDWIVIKALEKDRTRRYHTANGLAEDVRRFLANEPIAARPPGGWYRLRKLAERNKIVFGALGVIALILVVSVGILAAMLAREREAHRDADDARGNALAAQRKAETEAAKSEQVKRFLEEMLRGVGPAGARGRDTTIVREILEKATERVGRDLTNQPAVQAELWTTIGGIWAQLGVHPKAELLFRSALAKQRELGGNESPEVADLLLHLAGVLANPSESEVLDREALAIRRKLYGDENPEVTFAQNSLAAHLERQGKLAEAEAMHREVLALRRKLSGNESLVVAQTLGNLANAVRRRGNLIECEAINREALAIRRKLQGETDLEVAKAWGNLGLALQVQDKYAEAEPILREALKILRLNLNEWHPDVTITMVNLITVLARQGKGDAIAPLLPRLRETDFTRYPEGTDQLSRRASVLAQSGLWREAIIDAELLLKLRPADHASYHILAPLLVAQNDVNAYQELCRKIVEQFGETTDIYVADRMAKDCLILPIPGLDLAAVGKLADIPVSRGTNLGAFPLFQFCKALAEYRQGNFVSAVEWARQPLAGPFPHAAAEAGAVTAMVQHRLGRFDAARASLTNAMNIVNTRLPKLGSYDLGSDWRDVIIAHSLINEAKAMMATPAEVAPENP